MGTKYVTFKDLKFEPHPNPLYGHGGATIAKVQLSHGTFASVVNEVNGTHVFKTRFNVALYPADGEPIYKAYRTPQQVSYVLRRFQRQTEAAAKDAPAA